MIDFNPLFDRSYMKAQRAYDNQMPPEDDDEPCRHKWRKIPGEAPDGTRFVKCTKCGKVEEL